MNKRYILVLLLIVMMNLLLGCENKDITKKEKLNKDGIYTWNIDLTHDGKNEKIIVNTNSLYEIKKEKENTISIYSGEKLIWSSYITSAHADNRSIRIYNDGIKDYLIEWNPYKIQNTGEYTFKIFSLTNDGEEVICEEKNFEYDLKQIDESDILRLKEYGEFVNKYLEETYVLAEYLPDNGDVCYSTDAQKRTTIYDVEEDVKLMESAFETTEEIETNFSELHTPEEIDYVQELALKYLREETSYKVIAIDLADDTSDSYESAISKNYSAENMLAYEITCDRTEDNGTERQGYVIVMVRDEKDSEWYKEGIGKSFTYPFGK